MDVSDEGVGAGSSYMADTFLHHAPQVMMRPYAPMATYTPLWPHIRPYAPLCAYAPVVEGG